MAVEVRIPAIGMSTTEGVVTEWFAADGEQVEKGAPLYALELDKSVQEIDSPASGTLKVIAEPGETYDVGTLIAEIL
ncbi:MAG: lipoyl domain-containing protein [Halieaceae bacterium]|nr:lipoyl domain-containing protein [Halieaceae bacterium]